MTAEGAIRERVRAPVWAAAAVGLLCVALRLADVFIIRSDEWIGEQVVSKLAGLGLVLGYLVWAKLPGSAIGFRRPAVKRLLGVGLGYTFLVMGLAFVVQLAVLAAQGHAPGLEISLQGVSLGALAPQPTGMMAATSVIAGNLLNATMEESLFRGLLISHLAVAMSARRANVIQAVLFGLWHLVWPLRAVMDGEMALGAALGIGAGYVVVSTLIGLVWGAFFIWFRSLWVSILAHAVHNAALNVLHVTIATGGTAPLTLFAPVEAVLALALLPLLRRVAGVGRA